MDTNFNYVHVKASPRLEELVKEKMDKLKTRFDFLVAAEVYFKTEKSSTNEEGRLCEIKLSLPGPQIFAGANEENFDAAISKCVNDLKTQLQKRKEKMSTHM
ncbi:ribosome hibernation-promoting factor, HPF/YfiA family [Mesonia ostreae]|uniref:Ribosome-associated translation inhibitor RaiA n=1 Tax=Mesonia ostreae TaxID=861110 RepID=A0ABU2KHW9_9FLAO|nr:ribosome-associated translation inhibitor RaiA [Mesonia ostreae]MDT0294263.1 ribosome-associated translation inhibitor RaiA [Mesonia ostreae]